MEEDSVEFKFAYNSCYNTCTVCVGSLRYVIWWNVEIGSWDSTMSYRAENGELLYDIIAKSF